MTFPSHFAQPPGFAVWLLALFASQEEPILGDLLEEFTLRGSKSGVAAARRWYWRQTLETIPYLAGLGFRSAPWSTTAAIVVGFFLPRLMMRAVEAALFFGIEKFHLYDRNFGLYGFLASTAIDIAFLFVFLLTGLMVAFAARGTELVATTTLGLVHLAMVIAAVAAVLMQRGFDPSFWRNGWYLADTFAVVVSGIMVRRYRSRVLPLSLS